ncbi:LicD family protein [Pontibacter kalidii]|uniref:LicD family protein n=1 Tax=Pontibacter kalidii TaxID=2592049 RepID=UPI00224F24AB|nr:LicD family protein [Pontibacter kalidii]
MNFEHLFPDEREKESDRFRQCQLVMLRMFKILDFLCRKHQIQYFLNGGTLLGAIRHQGMIPWDDDLDVGMTRENYEKFVEFAVPELPQDIFFQSDETDRYFPAGHIIEAKLRDKYSSYVRRAEDKASWLKWHDGLQVDIAVFDQAYLPHNFFIYLQNRLLIFFLQRKSNKARARALRWIARHSPIPLVYASSYINNRRMVKLGKYYIKEQELAELLETDFEGMKAYIPIGWDNYLARRYGNYMQPPPPEKQKGHHSIDVPNPFIPCDHTEILYW